MLVDDDTNPGGTARYADFFAPFSSPTIHVTFAERVCIGVFSTLAASMVCALLTALCLQLGGFSRLYRDTEVHWTERARRLLPLRSLLQLSVSFWIYLQPLEFYCFLGTGPSNKWIPFIIVMVWMFSHILYTFILTLSDLTSSRIRSIKERLYDLFFYQMVYGSIFYVCMAVDLGISFSGSFVLDSVWLTLGFCVLISIHRGALLTIGKWAGAIISPEEKFAKRCEELAQRLKLRKRPTILIAKWSFVNALAYPLANSVLLPTEIFRYLDENELVAIVAHEYGHLKESFRQKASRVWLGVRVMILFAVPFIVIKIPLSELDSNTIQTLVSVLFNLIGIMAVVNRLSNEGWSTFRNRFTWLVILLSAANAFLVWRYFILVHLQSADMVLNDGKTWLNSPSHISSAALLSGLLSNSLSTLGSARMVKLEQAADKTALEAEETPGLYARALLKIYEANLFPAVTASRRKTHPPLYDRLVSAGMTPDFPRPAPPNMRMTTLLCFLICVIHMGLFFLSGSVILSEIGWLRASP